MGLLYIQIPFNTTKPLENETQNPTKLQKTKVTSKRKLGFEHHSPKQEVGYKRDLNFQKHFPKTKGGV